MRGAMVALGLVSCLGLAGCAGGMAGPTSEPAASAFPAAAQPQSGPPNMNYPYSSAVAPAAAEAAPAKPAPAPKPHVNRAARGAAAPVASGPEPDHELSDQEKVMQVRGDCWMAVERAKVGQDIDKRMAWVDKCIADKAK